MHISFAKPWLDRKKTMFGDYKKFIKKKYSKFDELALMFFALGSKSHICVIFQDNMMWTTCESGSRDDCDIIFLYHGNLFFDKVEEVDGGEPEKEDEWVPTEEDCDREKEDQALEREGIEGEEIEQDELEQDVDVEGVEEEEKTGEITGREKKIKSKDEEVKKTEKPDSVGKKDHGGARPKTVPTVQVPFNTRTRSAREKDEIEKEIEKNIQQGLVGEGPPATGLPVMGPPATGPPATGPPVKPTPKPKPKGGTPVKPKGSMPAKPKNKGKGKKSKSDTEEGKPEISEQGKSASEGDSVHLTRGQCKKIEDEEKKKKLEEDEEANKKKLEDKKDEEDKEKKRKKDKKKKEKKDDEKMDEDKKDDEKIEEEDKEEEVPEKRQKMEETP